MRGPRNNTDTISQCERQLWYSYGSYESSMQISFISKSSSTICVPDIEIDAKVNDPQLFIADALNGGKKICLAS